MVLMLEVKIILPGSTITELSAEVTLSSHSTVRMVS